MCETKTTLAEIPGLGTVRRCNCGCIHLTVGPMTLRLETGALEQITAMLQTATQKQIQLAADQQKNHAMGDWPPASLLPN